MSNLPIMKVVLIILLAGTLFSTIWTQDLRGRVHTADGRPVADAVVQPSGMLFSTTTKQDGTFLLDDTRMKYFWLPLDERKLLFVARKGYAVNVVILEKGQDKIDVVLQPETVEPPKIPDCSAEVPKGFNSRGQFIRITFPKTMKLKEESNFEYAGFTITAKERSAEAVLHSWAGVYSTTYAPSHLILNSKSFSVTRNGMGLDWNGQKADGTYWHYVGGAVGMIDSFVYETRSETLARQLDQVLATMCVRK